MRRLASLLLVLSLAVFVFGCGESPDAGHQNDPTPGGEATPPMDELQSDEAMDDYAAEQAKLSDGSDTAPADAPAEKKSAP